MPPTRPAPPASTRNARRFYDAVSAAPADGGGYAVLLDGRPVRRPAGSPLVLPTMALAEAIAAEWATQGERLDPQTMPLTRLANTALDRVRPDRDALIAALLSHVDGDLLCYRAEWPAELVARQGAAWQPLLDWAEAALSARLTVTAGLMPQRQSAEVTDALRTALDTLDDWSLTAAQCAAGACGSLVLALALVHGRLDGETCHALASLDETWQMEQWGEDEEALQARQVAHRDILAAERLARLAAQTADGA